MTITNETIIKAAKAAGLNAVLGGRDPLQRLWVNGKVFDPLNDDTDNAMIRRGAEIMVGYPHEKKTSWVTAFCSDATANVDIVEGDKAQAERKAVILCAAAKWDATNSTDPDDSDINQVHEGNAMQGEKA